MSNNNPTPEEIAQQAQIILAGMTDLSESSKAAAASVAESQRMTSTALSDAQSKLAEITATVTQATAAAVLESQRLAAAALADAQTKLADITATATQATAAKTQITDAQAVIATKSDHIQSAQEHADSVRAALDRALTAATQQATAAEGQKNSAQAASENIAEVLANVRATKATTETDAGSVASARKLAEESALLAKNLADKATTIEMRVAAYEKKLAEVDAACAAQLKKIEDLLEGATGVGLALSFDARRKAFLKPASRWQWLFVGSILAIVALTITGLLHIFQSGVAPTYDELLRMWLARLPVMIALVWLALHSSHESALAKRLEEDYGYKAAIASCFEGFKKQMSDVGSNVAPDSALAKLLSNTLEAIAAPPGRIYDKHKLAVSPGDEAKQATKALAEAANVIKSGSA